MSDSPWALAYSVYPMKLDFFKVCLSSGGWDSAPASLRLALFA